MCNFFLVEKSDTLPLLCIILDCVQGLRDQLSLLSLWWDS